VQQAAGKPRSEVKKAHALTSPDIAARRAVRSEWVGWLGRIGFAAQGDLLHDHSRAGRWLFGLTAAGLLSYGLFGIVQTRYHRV
jgi:hypothetical protein